MKVNLVAGDNWVETSAIVLTSVFHFAKVSEINLNYPMDQSYYEITFSYQVAGEVFVGEFSQYEAIEHGMIIPMFYNPDRPAENTLGLFPESTQSKIVTWIIAVSLALVLVYLERRFFKS